MTEFWHGLLGIGTGIILIAAGRRLAAWYEEQQRRWYE